MQQNNVALPSKRFPLFPGDSCYPLSPRKIPRPIPAPSRSQDLSKNGMCAQQLHQQHMAAAIESRQDPATLSMFDQMAVILQVIGTPSQADILDMRSHVARQYFKHAPRYSECDYTKRFPGATASGESCFLGCVYQLGYLCLIKWRVMLQVIGTPSQAEISCV